MNGSARASRAVFGALAEPRAQAWREAQLSLLRDKSGGDFSNPYFWAAFTLTGQWR